MQQMGGLAGVQNMMAQFQNGGAGGMPGMPGMGDLSALMGGAGRGGGKKKK